MRRYIAIALILFSLAVGGCFSNPKRDRFLIPEGYIGEISVSYSVPDAPLLPIEEGFRLVKVGQGGIFETSSEMRPGKLHDEFYFYKGETRRPFELPGELGGGYTLQSPARPGVYTFLFIVKALGPVTAK